MSACKPLSWLSTAPVYRGLLYEALRMADVPFMVCGRGEAAIGSGSVTAEQKRTITHAVLGLAAAQGVSDMRVRGMLVDATPEGREWQLEQALRDVVHHITSGAHHEQSNPYSRPCVVAADALMESLHGRMPVPARGSMLADIRFKGDKG